MSQVDVSSKRVPPMRITPPHATVVWFGKPNVRFPSKLVVTVTMTMTLKEVSGDVHRHRISLRW
jgi:hypothetical protein